MPFKVIAKLLKLCARKLYNALYIRNECPLTNNRLFVWPTLLGLNLNK